LSIDWTKYHTYKETTAILKDFAAEHKYLCRLYSIGKSFQGKEIWCMEITNYATGAPETKPGMYIDGNTHAGEVSGAEVCLYDIHFLLTNYKKDKIVTKLLDTKVFYVLPKINPDGSDAYLRKPGEAVDPDMKRVDDDGDGRLDEDCAEDLNGDGIIKVHLLQSRLAPKKPGPPQKKSTSSKSMGQKGHPLT
jgi:hypothetical protein